MRQTNDKVSAQFIINNPLLETKDEVHIDFIFENVLYRLLDEIEDLGYKVTNVCLNK